VTAFPMSGFPCRRGALLLSLMGAAVIGLGLVACSQTSTNAVQPSNGEPTVTVTVAGQGTTTQSSTVGGSAASDVTVTGCKQDPTDTTQVNVAGTIVNHSGVLSDYNFVVSIYNGSSPAAQAGVSKSGIAPGLVESWSASSTIAGSTSGSFSCRLRSVLRTPSHS
jgi:hypothetical protein